MQRFSANYIYPIKGSPIRNGIIEVDSNNMIINIIDPGNQVKELASMEFHNGVIVPGFVNTHCHLELSHLKGKIEQSGGIAEFVSQVRNIRKTNLQEVENGIKQALSTLKSNGTVAVGDICNTEDTLNEKLNSDILFHNFIEIFGLNPIDAKERVNKAIELLTKFNTSGKSTLTPHSSYSISESLYNLLRDELATTTPLVSIHYGESKQEYSILKDNSGLLAENFKELGIPINLPDGKSPLEIAQRFIPKNSKVIFVHNTFASRDEIEQLSSYFKESYFVLCPSSNLFIEGVLPDVPMLVSSGVDIALGTDSYASSNTISVFDQMMILLDNFPSLSFIDVLKWATLNGAKALNFNSQVGSFEVGKRPGLNLITHFDFNSMRPTKRSRVKRLV